METKAEKAYNPFLMLLRKKSKIQIFFQKKEGFYEITENITNKQEINKKSILITFESHRHGADWIYVFDSLRR